MVFLAWTVSVYADFSDYDIRHRQWWLPPFELTFFLQQGTYAVYQDCC